MDAESVAELAERAAVLEVSTEKPGSVTPTKSFKDLHYKDFTDAAHAMRAHMKEAAEGGPIGKAIYDSFQPSTTNVNFGIVLMFAPLAAAAGKSQSIRDLRINLRKVLKRATAEDTVWIYKAMRKCDLGGMKLKDNSLSDLDVFSDRALEKIKNEAITPLDVFRKVADIDRLASEWVSAYQICFGFAKRLKNLDENNIRDTYLEILSQYPDTFIARKVGLEEAKGVSEMAGEVIAGGMDIDEFDAYLRYRGSSLNPGTTADLTAATLFIKLLE